MESTTVTLSGQLATVGWVVLAGYMLAMIGIGVYCNKKYANTLSGFLMGGRNLGPWIFALTYGTTFLSSSSFIGNAGTAYKAGMAYMFMPIAQVVLIPLGMIFFSHRLRMLSVRMDAMTIPDFLNKRYKSKYMQILGSIMTILFIIPLMVGVVKAGALSISQLLGLSYPVSVFVISGVALVYLMFGGYMARAYTDVVQGVLMVVGMLLVLIAGFFIIGGPTAIAGKLAELDPQLLETPGPMGWSNLFLFSSVFAISPWGLPQLVQTNFTIRSKKTVYASAIVLSVWLALVLYGSMIIGNMGRAYFGDFFINDVDQVYPALTLAFFPNVLGAIVICAIIAAAMSTIDGVLMTTGSAFGVDIYRKYLKKDATDKQVMWASNGMMIAAILVVVWWALNPPPIMLYFTTTSHSLVASGFIVPIFMGIWNKKSTTGAGIASMTAGVATCLLWYFGSGSISGPYWLGMPPFIMALIVSLVVFMIAQKMSKPMDKAFVDDLFSKEAEAGAYAIEET